MLKSHMDAIENTLVRTSSIPANSGHSLHKGTPREAFIKQFLDEHLPSNVDIGTGEIIDANSRPGQSRNQFDIVIYRKSYPKLHFGGGVLGFLAESVIATIEVKSEITKDKLRKAICAARTAKQLSLSLVSHSRPTAGPPTILNFVVAYHGPASMKTVYGWIPQIYSDLEIPNPDLPLDRSRRRNTASQSIDGVFVLNKGFLYFDNAPYTFRTQEDRSNNPSSKWIYGGLTNGNLLLLFLFLQSATADVEDWRLDAVKYLSSYPLDVTDYECGV